MKSVRWLLLVVLVVGFMLVPMAQAQKPVEEGVGVTAPSEEIQSVEAPVEESVQKPVEESVQKPVEEPNAVQGAEQPVENSAKPVEDNVAAPVEGEQLSSQAEVSPFAASEFNSGFQVQNLEATPATIQIIAYNQDGTKAADVTGQVLTANGSKTYNPLGNSPTPTTGNPGLGLAGAFDGSVVISSDKQVAAIANVFAKAKGNGSNAFGSYGSFSKGGSEVNLPLITKKQANTNNDGGYSTKFNVQNTSSVDVSVVVAYTPRSATEGKAYTTPAKTIKPGAAVTFDQETESDSNIGAMFVGSAKITATGGEVVASVLQLGPNTMSAYNGFTSGSASLVVPLFQANNSGYITGIQIQNIGTAPAEVTVNYKAGAKGTSCSETQTVPAGAASTFGLGVFTAGKTCGSAAFVGSATITAKETTASLVAIVNQLNIANQKAGAYDAFNPASATKTVSLPLLMGKNSGFFTGYNVVNPGTADVNVTCSYSAYGSVTPTAKTSKVAAGASVTFNDDANASGAKYVGSATCTADGNILAVVNQVNLTGKGDQFMVYEGFNQ